MINAGDAPFQRAFALTTRISGNRPSRLAKDPTTRLRFIGSSPTSSRALACTCARVCVYTLFPGVESNKEHLLQTRLTSSLVSDGSTFDIDTAASRLAASAGVNHLEVRDPRSPPLMTNHPVRQGDGGEGRRCGYALLYDDDFNGYRSRRRPIGRSSRAREIGDPSLDLVSSAAAAGGAR